MTQLIHGDDSLSSRKYFLKLKTSESIYFDAENINLNELTQIIKGDGLFLKSKRILIDNLFTKNGIKKLDSISEILTNHENLEIYFYADKVVEAKQYKIFKNLEIKLFKIPATIWNFLDSLRPNNKNNILLFQRTLTNTDVEIIFAMLVRQYRLLLGISSNSKNNIDEIKRLAPWQKSKLVQQASYFKIENLKSTYKKLQLIDKSVKTGKSKLNTQQNIDFLLSDI